MKTSENACVLTVNSIPTLIILVHLLNGLLRTPKIDQFNTLIHWLSDNGYGQFVIMPVNTSSLASNSWLAGFIDADGGFKIRITAVILDLKIEDFLVGKILRKGRIACSFVLEQRMVSLTGSSYLPILTAMCNEFGCKLNTSNHNGRTYYIFALSSLAQLTLLVSYLDKHQLLTSKFLDYSDWRKAHILMLDRRHLIPEGADVIANLKAGMNNSRTVYT